MMVRKVSRGVLLLLGIFFFLNILTVVDNLPFSFQLTSLVLFEVTLIRVFQRVMGFKRNFGFVNLSIAKLIGYALITFIMCLGLLYIVAKFTPGTAIVFGYPPIANIGYWFVLIGIMVAAVAEEILFRGFLLGYLKSICTYRVIPVLFAAIAFTALHFGCSIVKGVFIFLWWLVLMIPYIRTKSLYPGIIAHILYNFLIFTVLFYSSI